MLDPLLSVPQHSLCITNDDGLFRIIYELVQKPLQVGSWLSLWTPAIFAGITASVRTKCSRLTDLFLT